MYYPRILVRGLQGGGDVCRLNAPILCCAVGAAHSLNKLQGAEAESERVISSAHPYSLMDSQPTFKVILEPAYIFPWKKKCHK